MCCRKFSSPFCLSCLNSMLQLNVNGSIDILLCLKEACVISKANICTLSLAPLRAIFLLHRNVVQRSEERSDTFCQDGRISILFMAIQFSPSWTYVLLVRQLKNGLTQSLRANRRKDWRTRPQPSMFPPLARHSMGVGQQRSGRLRAGGALLGMSWPAFCTLSKTKWKERKSLPGPAPQRSTVAALAE